MTCVIFIEWRRVLCPVLHLDSFCVFDDRCYIYCVGAGLMTGIIFSDGLRA